MNQEERREQYFAATKILTDELPVYWLNTVPYHTSYNENLGNPPMSVWGTVAPWDEMYWKKQPN